MVHTDQCIELLAYVYNKGVKNWDAQLRYPVVAQVKPGQQVYCRISAEEDKQAFPHYLFEVDAPGQRWLSVEVPITAFPPPFGLTHGLFFGGEMTAPHDMTVNIDRV